MYKISLLFLSVLLLIYPQNELLAKKGKKEHRKEHRKDRKEKKSRKHKDKHKNSQEHSHKHRSSHHSRHIHVHTANYWYDCDPLDSWDWYNWTHGTGLYTPKKCNNEQPES